MMDGAGSMPFTGILMVMSIVALAGACAVLSKTPVLRSLVYNDEYRPIECLIAGISCDLSIERMLVLMVVREHPFIPLMLLTHFYLLAISRLQSGQLPIANKSFVFVMGTNAEPNKASFPFACQSAVSACDSNGPIIASLFEVKRRVFRVVLPDLEVLSCSLLNFGKQIRKAFVKAFAYGGFQNRERPCSSGNRIPSPISQTKRRRPSGDPSVFQPSDSFSMRVERSVFRAHFAWL